MLVSVNTFGGKPTHKYIFRSSFTVHDNALKVSFAYFLTSLNSYFSVYVRFFLTI